MAKKYTITITTQGIDALTHRASWIQFRHCMERFLENFIINKMCEVGALPESFYVLVEAAQ